MGGAPPIYPAQVIGRCAIILTTNRPLEDWGQVLGDTAAAGAILDRFLHHAEVIQLAGARSYRMHERQRRRTTHDGVAGLASQVSER
jgi:DNA replication protein DnaC